jgi:hypothetical protein
MLKIGSLGHLAIIACFCCGTALASGVSSQPILYVGDSIADGLFGATVDRGLRTLSDNVTTLAWCGSTPATWLNNAPRARTICGFWEHDPSGSQSRSLPKTPPDFVSELKQVKPQVTVVQLGTNIAAIYPTLDGKAVASVKAMMDAIKKHGSQCVWIGPPPVDPAKEDRISAEKLQQTSDMIKSVAASQGCTYIDTLRSIPVVGGPTLDGIHPTGFLGQTWADKIAPQLTPAVTRALNVTASPSAPAPLVAQPATEMINLGFDAALPESAGSSSAR